MCFISLGDWLLFCHFILKGHVKFITDSYYCCIFPVSNDNTLLSPCVSHCGDGWTQLDSPCSGSLCCGWPGTAAGWSPHCPAGDRAPPWGRATSTPSPWFQSWTSCRDNTTHTVNHYIPLWAADYQTERNITHESKLCEVFFHNWTELCTRAGWSWRVPEGGRSCGSAGRRPPPAGWTWTLNGPSRAPPAAAAGRWETPHPAGTGTNKRVWLDYLKSNDKHISKMANCGCVALWPSAGRAVAPGADSRSLSGFLGPPAQRRSLRSPNSSPDSAWASRRSTIHGNLQKPHIYYNQTT